MKKRGRGRGRAQKVFEAPSVGVPSWLNDYDAKYFHCPHACSETSTGFESLTELASLERSSENLVAATQVNHQPRIVGYFIPLETVQELQIGVKKAPSIKYKGYGKRRKPHHRRKHREGSSCETMETNSDNQTTGDSAIFVTDQEIPLASLDLKLRSSARGRPRKDDMLLNSAKVLSRHQNSISQPTKSSFIPPIRNVSFGERCERCSLVQSLSTNRKKLSFEGEPLRPLVVV